MKHRIKNTSLSRTSEHRKSLMKNLSVSLFKNGYICTTKAKADHFKSYVGRFISRFLQKDRFNAYKYVSKKINMHKHIINFIMNFYDKNIQNEFLSNYICVKKVSKNCGGNVDIVIIYLMKDSIS